MSAVKHHQVIIIGAGAAGLMCALTAGYRGRDVLLLDNAKQLGRKILISGGGRCNFTNLNIEPAAYLCRNPHFCKSALARFTQWDFIAMVERHGIAFHEKTLGQLFCDDSAKDIVDMLTTECDWAGVKIQLRTEILNVQAQEGGYLLLTSQGDLSCESLVIATGGLSMPKLGATPFGLQLAQQFGLNVLPTCAGLVPFILQPQDKANFEQLSGISLPVVATAQCGKSFREALLFTHRGLSGPAVLQISSYWKPGESISFNLLPDTDLTSWLKEQCAESPKLSLRNAMARLLPKRLVEVLQEMGALPDKALNQLGKAEIESLQQYFNDWRIQPGGTEGYRTAEVTLGGVDTDELSSKTMEARKQPGLYFIGEVVDVSGWLGGYNFQWAWSSGYAAGEVV
ncbi:BaiN/RdsA family NAD(P)/FAD-dependent oxidoreductase [Shewanella sedimentimangrovi]|uniref:NAD(P)/FAD-dependent oxidoreductase n=1 Tax=Shewanella sedimentimangrovi TaxID=2814293 RepID=A0ABX7R2E1_9GAMM|nr:NAD(P)/FAD-dependent oxidoreductase [Shewanella sedimentimangrovi]QSX37331.1 NAD(P)/FAD-dependent oxidoreductase [Shewanella sedimentimangrovi]